MTATRAVALYITVSPIPCPGRDSIGYLVSQILGGISSADMILTFPSIRGEAVGGGSYLNKICSCFQIFSDGRIFCLTKATVTV